MRKEKLVIILIIMIVSWIGCQYKNYHVNEYEVKKEGDKIDKNVKIKYFLENSRGELEIKFDQKEIPFKFLIYPDVQTYQGRFSLSGQLGEGSVSVILLSSNGEVIEKFSYSNGKIVGKEHFDLYYGEYILQIEFYAAKSGNLKFKFDSL